ncbi:MAG TPA: ATP-binding protein [Candidatus Polarisedimenticolaceae bacterium]
MRAPRLSLLLILLSTALLVLAIGAVSWSASRVLGRIAEEQALSSARVGAADAVNALQREQDTLATDAELLAERPTLRALAASRDRASLERVLDTFRRTSHLDLCAVIVDGAIVGAAGGAVPDELLALAHRRVRVSLTLDDAKRSARITSFAEVSGHPGAAVLVSDTITPTNDASVRLWSRDAIERQGFGPRSPLREAALQAGESTSRKLREERALVAVVPVRSAGAIVGIAEAEVPLDRAIAERKRWVRDVRRIALGVLALTVAGSFLLGRYLAGPIEEMTKAAQRIGLGDLETPVPSVAGGELGSLARALDEMRLRLLEQSRQLGRRRAESDAVLSGIVDGVFAVDGERRIRLLNPRAAKLLGITPDEALGRFCGDVLRPMGPDGVRPCEEHCPILEARAGGRARAVEYLEPREGTKLTIVVTSAPPVEGSQIQLVREEMEVETTRRLRDTVVANISHEFRTPLAAQLASIELLRDRIGDLPLDEARKLVLSMERGALRLTRLIDNLLESVRLDSGERGIRKAEVDLDAVVEEAVESMRPLLDQRRQQVLVELPHPLPTVVGDAPRLVQVVVNLLANANKFALEGTTIRIGGAVEPSGVTLWVEDEGPGLPEGDDDTVFERFVRRAGEEPEQSGMGLGLWIARSIVERHGGRIYAATVERGAKMCIVLPT